MVNIRMKIVHAVYSMEMGGAEMMVAQLCRIQRAGGQEVSVCAYSQLGVLGEALRNEGFPVLVMGIAHPARTALRYLKLFRELRPDVVHCHNPAPTLQAAAAAKLARTPCVVATRHSLVSPPYDFAAEVKFGIAARWVDWVAGICEVTCGNLRGAPLARRDRIVRVYNGASPVPPSVARPSTDGLTLIFVGRLAAVKDLPTLLRAVSLAAPRVPGLNMWIVGDGPVRAELELLARALGVSDQVTFFGQRLDTDSFFQAADVLVMSSVSEGLPMSLLQSMSAGKPAILTDVGGMGEMVRLSEGGLFFPVGDAAAMADAIVRLADSGDLRAGLGARAKAFYERELTLECMAREYQKLYESRGRSSNEHG